jgi:hypothetical protein
MESEIGGQSTMESVQLAVISTGGKWARFVIAIEPRQPSSRPLYWDGTKWVPERRRALLYANPGLAQRHMDKLRAKM